MRRSLQFIRKLESTKLKELRECNAELEKQVRECTAQVQATLAHLRQQAQREALINQIVRAVWGTLVLDEVLQTTVDRLHEAMGVSCCQIFRLDSNSQLRACYISIATQDRESLMGIYCNKYRCYYETLARGRSVIISQLENALQPELQESSGKLGIRAILILPLLYRQSLVGGISLYQCDREREWTNEDVAFVSAIADYCAIAIQQAEMYQQAQTELSDRERTESALRESEERYRRVVETAEEGIWIIDAESKTSFANQKMTEMLGYAADEMLDMPLFAFMDEEGKAIAAANVERRRQGIQEQHDFKFRRKDGSDLWAIVSTNPIFDESGQYAGALGMVTDITDRIRAESASRESEQRLQAILDWSPAAIFLKDLQGRYITINRCCEMLFNLSKEQVLGKTDRDVLPNAIADAFQAYDQKILEAGIPIESEEVFSNKDEINTFFTIKFPLKDSAGVPYAIGGISTDITGRKRAEEERDRFFTLSLDLFCITNFNGCFTRLNPAWEKVLGFTNEELTSKPYIEFVHPEDRAATIARSQKFATGTDTLTGFENRFLCKDGSYKWLLWNATSDAADRLIYGVARDITDRKQAEEALAKSEAKFRSLIQNSTDIITICDIDGVFCYASDSVEKILGFKPEELIGKNGFEFVHPEDVAHLTASFNNLIQNPGMTITVEYRTPDKDGYWLVIESTMSNLLSNEHVAGIVANSRDITERKQVSSALRESEERFSKAFHSGPVAIAITTCTEGRYIDVNDSFQRLMGYCREEIVGRTASDIQAHVNRFDRQQLMQKLLERGALHNLEYKTRTKSGEIRDVLVSIEKIDLSGEPCFLSMFLDISDRKRAEEALAASEAKFRSLIQNSSDIIIIADRDGVYHYISDSIEKILGYKPEDLVGTNGFKTVHPEDVANLMGIHNDLIQNPGMTVYVEYRCRDKDGSWRMFEATGTNLLEDPFVAGIVVNSRDITDRKLVQEELYSRNLKLLSLHKISEIGLTNQSLKVAFQEIVEEISSCTDFPIVAIEFYDEARQKMVFQAVKGIPGFPAEGMEIPVDETLSGVVVRTGQPLVETNAFDRQEYASETLRQLRVQTFVCVPMIVGERAIGTLSLAHPEAIALSHRLPKFAVNLANHVASLTERKQALLALQKLNEELEIRVFDRTAELINTNEKLRREIADRKALEAKNAMLAIAVEHAGDAIEITDGEARFEYVNSAFEQITGYTCAEVLGKTPAALLRSGKHDEAFYQTIENTLAVGGVWRGQLTGKRKDGSLSYQEATISPVVDATGAIAHYVAVKRDITKRKLAESAQRRREQEFKALVENNPDLIQRFDRQLRYVYVNPAIELVSGLSAGAFIGKTHQQLGVPNEIVSVETQALQSVFETGCEDEIEFALPTLSGIKHYHARFVPEFATDGTTETVLAISRDITKLKQAEAEIVNALAKEKELNELKSRFVSMVSHEFRTPLITILLHAELLEHYDRKLNEAQKRQYSQRIQTAVKNMTQLLNDVLTIGKTDAGKVELNRDLLDLTAFCRDLVSDIQLGAGDRHTIAFISEGCCDQAYLDEKLLRQILTNLLSNALKYSPQGGTVYFSCCCQNGMVLFQVRDRGIGIPLKDQEHLFETFYRASNADSISGTGLGLAIVKRCVDLHGGEINVSSKLGEGTTFTVTLPLMANG